MEVEHVEREMVLIKIAPAKGDKADALRIAEIFRGRIIDSGPKTFTIETTGNEKKNEAFVEMMKPYNIKEFVRTGKVAIAREGVKKT